MEKLSEEMSRNYVSHPAFKFDGVSLSFSSEAIEQFNQRYLAAKAIGVTVKENTWACLRQELLDTLSRVFLSVSSQCQNESENTFINELARECSRALEAELQWYRKPRARNLLDFADEKARKDAVEFQSFRHLFGTLSPRGLKELSYLAERELSNLRANVDSGRLKREDLSISSGATQNAIRKALNREFKTTGVFDLLGSYTGRQMLVTGVALELSVPQSGWWLNAIEGLSRPPSTLYAHLDESVQHPKAIIYLSDVGEKNGPTSCYPAVYEALQLTPLQELIGRVVGNVGNSAESPLKNVYAKKYHHAMSSALFRRHFMRLPPSLRFNSHFGWDVIPGGDLEAVLLKSERKLIGPAGTFIAFDGGKLLHRGGLMEEGERVALQVVFSDVSTIDRAKAIAKRIFT